MANNNASRNTQKYTPEHAARPQSGAHAPQGEESAAKRKAAETADEAKGQAKSVAQDAKGAAQDLAQTAQSEVAEVKDAAVEQAKSFAGTMQEQLGSQAGTQQERLALQARSITDDLHRVLTGEQPQSDMVRQAFTTVADRAESLTQRLETTEPADLVREVRGFAARKPGTFLAMALGVGLVAGRLTRGMRDAAQPELPSARHAQTPGSRREMDSMGVQSDVTPHHIASTVPAHTGDDAARSTGGLPHGTTPLNTDPYGAVDPVTDAPRAIVDPFDQTQTGGRA